MGIVRRKRVTYDMLIHRYGFKAGHLGKNDTQPEIVNNGIIEICVDCFPYFVTQGIFAGRELEFWDELLDPFVQYGLITQIPKSSSLNA